VTTDIRENIGIRAYREQEYSKVHKHSLKAKGSRSLNNTGMSPKTIFKRQGKTGKMWGYPVAQVKGQKIPSDMANFIGAQDATAGGRRRQRAVAIKEAPENK